MGTATYANDRIISILNLDMLNCGKLAMLGLGNLHGIPQNSLVYYLPIPQYTSQLLFACLKGLCSAGGSQGLRRGFAEI